MIVKNSLGCCQCCCCDDKLNRWRSSIYFSTAKLIREEFYNVSKSYLLFSAAALTFTRRPLAKTSSVIPAVPPTSQPSALAPSPVPSVTASAVPPVATASSPALQTATSAETLVSGSKPFPGPGMHNPGPVHYIECHKQGWLYRQRNIINAVPFSLRKDSWRSVCAPLDFERVIFWWLVFSVSRNTSFIQTRRLPPKSSRFRYAGIRCSGGRSRASQTRQVRCCSDRGRVESEQSPSGMVTRANSPLVS